MQLEFVPRRAKSMGDVVGGDVAWGGGPIKNMGGGTNYLMRNCTSVPNVLFCMYVRIATCHYYVGTLRWKEYLLHFVINYNTYTYIGYRYVSQ